MPLRPSTGPRANCGCTCSMTDAGRNSRLSVSRLVSTTSPATTMTMPRPATSTKHSKSPTASSSPYSMPTTCPPAPSCRSPWAGFQRTRTWRCCKHRTSSIHPIRSKKTSIPFARYPMKVSCSTAWCRTATTCGTQHFSAALARSSGGLTCWKSAASPPKP
ncbi:hypothetical protein D3C84_942830 [compost metagenome]